jgi:D-aminoacyl-tRNA deacylase
VRIVLQRVTRASVSVDGETVSEIGPGLLALVGIGRGDPPGHAERLAEKVASLRVFEDDEGKTNRSLADVGGEVLVVSQFTLYGDLRRGRRPSWTDAEDPTEAERQVERFADALEANGARVGRGSFGAHMAVELVNDGPMTLILDTATLFREVQIREG